MIGTVDQPRSPRITSMPLMPGQAEVEDHGVGVVVGGEAQRLLPGRGERRRRSPGPAG